MAERKGYRHGVKHLFFKSSLHHTSHSCKRVSITVGCAQTIAQSLTSHAAHASHTSWRSSRALLFGLNDGNLVYVSTCEAQIW